MSYVGKMKDLIELYLAELKSDGIEGIFGVKLTDAESVLTDFAQWLEDDVQDTETTPEGNDLEWVEHQEWLESGKELNLTGFGDIVDAEVERKALNKQKYIQEHPECWKIIEPEEDSNSADS